MTVTRVKITGSAKNKINPGKAAVRKAGYLPSVKKEEVYPPREMIYVHAENSRRKS